MQLSVGCGVAVGLVLWLLQGPVVGIFTQDPIVAVAAGAVLPMVALLMPLDAAASIMDGGLIAASQTNLLSVIQVVGSLAQHAVLTWVVAQGWVSVLSVWGVLKMMSVFRAAGGWYVIFASPWSKYTAPQVKQA